MVDPILIGQLIEAVNQCTELTKATRDDVAELRQEQNKARVTFEHINRDIREIREGMAAKPNEHDVREIATEVINERFPDDEATRKDLTYLRRSRERHENVSTIKLRVTQAVIITIVLGALGWTGSAVLDKVKEDVKQEQHPS